MFLKKLVKGAGLDFINSSGPDFTPLFSKNTRFPSIIRKRLLFKNNLLLLKRLRFNDLFIRNKQLKSLFNKKNLTYQQSLVKLNSRLDVLLYKTRLFSSIASLNQFILHEGVLINNKKVFNKNYILKEGDVILFHPNRRLFYKNYFTKLYHIKTNNFNNVIESDYSIFCFIIKDLSSDTLLKSIYCESYEDSFWVSRLFK